MSKRWFAAALLAAFLLTAGSGCGLGGLPPPLPTVNVEVQTSVVSSSPTVAGITTGSPAVVTITAPDGTQTTVATMKPPVSSGTASYDVASPPTVALAANTTFQYSANFTQFPNTPGNPVTGSFTTPAAAASSGPYAVSIVLNPFAVITGGGVPSKPLP